VTIPLEYIICKHRHLINFRILCSSLICFFYIVYIGSHFEKMRLYNRRLLFLKRLQRNIKRTVSNNDWFAAKRRERPYNLHVRRRHNVSPLLTWISDVTAMHAIKVRASVASWRMMATAASHCHQSSLQRRGLASHAVHVHL